MAITLVTLVFFLLFYKYLRENYYILFTFFLLLGSSYLLNDEMIFGFINIGVHEYKLIPGLTLYSKDIIIIAGFIFVFSLKKIRHLRKDLYFSQIPYLFIILILINLLVKLGFGYDNFDFNGIKSIIRAYSSILIYYIIFFLYRENQFYRLLILLFAISIITTFVFLLNYAGIIYIPGLINIDDSLSFGAVKVSRYLMPHGFPLFIPFFIALGVLFIHKKNFYIKLFSSIVLILMLISGLVSTYRTYSYILILGVLFSLVWSIYYFKKFNLFYISVLILVTVYFVFIQLSEALNFDIINISILRITSGFEEMQYGSGTGGYRMLIVEGMMEQFNGMVFFFGKLFQKGMFTDIYGANNDIGLMSTLMQGGIFVLIPIVLTYKRVIKLFNDRFDNMQAEIIRISTLIFFLAIIPSMLFNYDFWFQQPLSQVLFFFMGLFDAIYYDKVLKAKEIQENHIK